MPLLNFVKEREYVPGANRKIRTSFRDRKTIEKMDGEKTWENEDGNSLKWKEKNTNV